MKKSIYRLLVAAFLTGNNGTALCQQNEMHKPVAQSMLEYIDPTIGNIGHLLEPTRPTVHLPHQVIRVYPIRKDYEDDQITGFPFTAVSHRLGEVFMIKPSVDSDLNHAWDKRMSYDYDLEINRPWYYSTYLIDDQIKVEFAPSDKCGIYRFTFPAAQNGKLLIKTINDGLSYLHFDKTNSITGVELWTEATKVYMYGELSFNGQADNKNEKQLIVYLPPATTNAELRYAISFISAEQAKMNFEHEFFVNNKIKSIRTFNDISNRAKAEWEKIVGQVKVTGGSAAQKRSFYTALYRCNERMVNISENGSYYSGFDKQVHKDPRAFYVDDWAWDTHLALHPLNMILHPLQEADMLSSYTRMFEQSGWMPSFPVLFGDYACMNGHHESIVILDAYRKGIQNFNIKSAYEGMKKNAMQGTLLPWRNGAKTTLDEFYQTHGFFPALAPGEKENVSGVHTFEKRQAVAVTLGACYDDWAAGQLAKDLGERDDYILFEHRSHNYKHLWNDTVKMFTPRDEKGNWINIDPKFDGGPGGRDYYDENNGWTYLWQVQHDIPGLIQLMGDKKAFEKKLDQLFREGLNMSKFSFWNKFPDATGLVGQFSMGNEPSFHIPYLYNFTGSPWKTQKRIRSLLDLWFKDNVFGIPGDEDGGGMSAFVVFSSMGFYPVVPGLPLYTIGSPVFTTVTIQLENGKQFHVKTRNNSKRNKYIQRAWLNGKLLDTPWFTHRQLINGGTLELEMGALPDLNWGTRQFDPYSSPN